MSIDAGSKKVIYKIQDYEISLKKKKKIKLTSQLLVTSKQAPKHFCSLLFLIVFQNVHQTYFPEYPGLKLFNKLHQ